MDHKNRLKLLALLFPAIITGCLQRPEDIKLSDLQKSCDHVEAIIKVQNRYIEIVGKRSLEELSDEEMDLVNSCEQKWNDIGEAAKKKYTVKEIEECPNIRIGFKNNEIITEIKRRVDNRIWEKTFEYVLFRTTETGGVGHSLDIYIEAKNFSFSCKDSTIFRASANQIGLEINKVNNFKKGMTHIDGLADNMSLVHWLEKARTNQVSEPLSAENGYVVALVTDVKFLPPR